MATLEEILQLDKVQSSIKKIDLFVSQKIKYSNEYMKALTYKGIILNELGKTNDALKLLYEYVPSIDQMDNEAIVDLFSAIIEISIENDIYDQAAKYIRIKQEYLPVSRQSEYIKDTTRLYLKRNDYENAKNALKRYLDDDISPDEEIYALENLANIYYFEKSYDEYLDCIPKLESHYSSTLDIYKQEIISKNKIEIFYNKKNYIQVAMQGTKFFQEYDSQRENKLYVASYMIRSYIFLNDTKKASIIESNNEEYLSDECIAASIEFCKAAIDLYNRTNTANSVIEYRRKIEEYENLLKEEQEPLAKEKKTKTKKKEIVVPEITEDIPIIVHTRDTQDGYFSPITVLNPKKPEEIVVKQKLVEDIKAVKNIEVSENYTHLSLVFEALNHVELHSKFREAFRLCAIEIERQYKIQEIYVLCFDGKYKGYHYKKERVYDKKLKVDNLEGTLGYQSLLLNQEAFLDQSDRTYSKNIVDGKDYDEDMYAIAIPIHNSITTIGSISYISKNPFLGEELVYESLKLITTAINTRLLESFDVDFQNEKNKKMNFIMDNMSSGVKENREGYYHFSAVASKMLGVIDALTEKDYLLHLNATDAAKYKECMNELYNLNTMDLVLEYDFKKDNEILHIKERFYPLLTDGMIVIYSLLDNLTKEKKDRDDLVDLAYKNPISKMETMVKLTADLAIEYNKKKMSLAIVSVKDSQLFKDLYGLNFYNQVIRAIGIKLIDAFSHTFTNEVYHIEGTTYAILLRDINDKRVVDGILKEALAKCVEDMFTLNFRVKILFNCGVYRLAKNAILNDVSEMITYASDALIDASRIDPKANTIAHYDSKLALERFRENNLVTHISEAIDLGKLAILYKQIIDLKSSSVIGYTLSLSLDNYEINEEEMLKVIKRKGMLAQMEKYVIATAIKELKMFYNEVRGYLNLFIPVSKITLEERFLEFLSQQQVTYKINPTYITFVAESIHGTPLEKVKEMGYHLASYDIFDVYRGLCEYFIYDFHSVTKESVSEILELCNKHNVLCILSNMDSSEDIEFARSNNYRFVYGNYYRNKRRMMELIAKVSKKING